MSVRWRGNCGGLAVRFGLGIRIGVLALTAGWAPAAFGAGGLDPSFGDGGIVRTPIGDAEDSSSPFGLAIQADGKIVMSGYTHVGFNSDFAVVRYNADGTLDADFDGDGIAVTPIGIDTDFGSALAIQSDGKIVVVGEVYDFATTFDFAVVRYNGDGSLDTSFGGDGIVVTAIGPGYDVAAGVIVQPNGKILVVGASERATALDFALVRYNPDGSLDTTFDGDGIVLTAIGGGDDIAFGVAQRVDGRIMVSGRSRIATGNAFAVAQYLPTGALDTNFSGDGIVVTTVGSGGPALGGFGMAIQPDGRALVAGIANNGATEDVALVRYMPAGVLDLSFDGDGKVITPIGNGDDGGVDIALQPDGRIVVSGYAFNGSTYDLSVLRYRPNGMLDTSFDGDGKVVIPLGGSNRNGFGVAIQPNGRIVVSGAAYDGGSNDFAAARLFGLGVCGNGVVEDGEQCDDGGTAGGDCCSPACLYEPAGASCPDDGLPCSGDVCSATGTCLHAPKPPATPCRPAAGVCDVAEACDGATAACPADLFVTGGVCRPAAGACDLAESCDGAAAACPADAKSNAVCRGAADVCDVAETCSGSGDDCPPDAFLPATTLCRADAGDCDVPDFCSGDGAACPADAGEADDTPCTDLSECTQFGTCSAGVCIGSGPLDCDDGNGCTLDACDPSAGCIHTSGVLSGCKTAGKSLLLIKQRGGGATDKLIWKWSSGQSLGHDDLADPRGTAEYALCIHAGAAGTLLGAATVPPHATRWRLVGDAGFKYFDASLSAGGIRSILLKGSAGDRSKALMKGKGSGLPDPVLGALPYPVIVQLVNNESGACLESSFDSPDEIRNDAGQFKAKTR